MADSLILASAIELLMRDSGPPYSHLPGLENTIFALNDQQDTFSLGAPQPTVDILATLITDGERPQGRRASNRTVALPIAIISDTRDNLAAARETLFSLVNADWFTLRYERADSNTGPIILDCWRAEPANITYSQLAEQQFACELTLNFQALPYGRSDAPNTITFASPVAGSTPPPDPILMDGFDQVEPTQTAAWALFESPNAVAGNTAIYCVATTELTVPQYTVWFPQPKNLMPGMQTDILNVMQFWAGFASQKFYGNWANHQSEIIFNIRLYDGGGHQIAAGCHQIVTQSNNMSQPKWSPVSIRMPVSNVDFDYTNVVGYTFTATNHAKATDALYLKDSQIYLDSFYAVSPSSAVSNVERGSIYRLNGIEGSVHTPVNIAATQEGSTAPQTTTFNGVGRSSWQAPAGVTRATVTAIGTGGPAGATSWAGGGGGGEWAQESVVPLTPGRVYPVVAYGAQAPLRSAPDGTTNWYKCGRYTSTLPTTNINVPFTAAVPVGNTVFVQVCASSHSPAVRVTDPVNGQYDWIAYATARDGTYVAIFAKFNANALTTSNYVTVTFSQAVADVVVMMAYKGGLLSSMADSGSSGFSAGIFNDSGWWINSNPMLNALNDWMPGNSNTAINMGDLSNVNQQPFSPIARVTAPGGGNPAIISSPMPVREGYSYYPKLYANLSAAGSVTITIQWLNTAGTQIGTGTYTATYTANQWNWNFKNTASGALTAPTGTATCRIQASAPAGTTFGVGVFGLVSSKGAGGHYIAITGNASGVHPATPQEWTLLDSGYYGNLACDVYMLNNVPGEGIVFGQVGSFSGNVNWCASLIYVWGNSWFSRFDGDGVIVQAHGGTGGNYTGTGSGAGGPGGTGSLNSSHSDGGNGAGAVSATVGGGGGGSGGSDAATTFIDDTDSSFTWGFLTTPPQLISSGIPSTHTITQGRVFTSGTKITQFGAVGPEDCVLVVILADDQNANGHSVYLSDTKGNTYGYIQDMALLNNRRAYLLYAHKTNQPGGRNLTPLVVGDEVFLKSNSTAGNYYVFTFVHHGVERIIGNVGGGNGGGTQNGRFTATSATVNVTGFNNPNPGHFVFSISDAASRAVTSMAPSQNPSAGVFDMSTFRPSNQYWTNNQTVVQAYWKGSESTTSATFQFSRADAAEVSYLITTFQMRGPNPPGAAPWWQTWNNDARVRNGTAHLTNQANSFTRIAFQGQQMQLVGQVSPNSGQALVSLDGKPFTIMDTYSPVEHYQSVIYDTGRMSAGQHTLEVLVPWWRNPQSTGPWINLDGYFVITPGGAGVSAPGQTGGGASPGGGAGGNGGSGGANGSNGGNPGGGGGGPGGLGGYGQVQLTYISQQPPFKTLILHRPSIDGSKTLLPYIACASTTVPTNDIVQGLTPGIPPHFKGTYTIMVAAATFNNPGAARTITVTVTEYESAPGGYLTGTYSTQVISRSVVPNTDAQNYIVAVGELTLPNRDIPEDNANATYQVIVNSSNGADQIEDVMFLDTMGQTIFINETTGYAQFFVDEPFPDRDIGLIAGSQFDRDFAVSVMQNSFPSGGPLTVEPGDNILFAYCREGAPSLVASYFPRYFIDRVVS